MGQAMPLPERVPAVSNKQRRALAECGVIVNKRKENPYVGYTLPEGWRMVDVTTHRARPDWIIIDNENNIRFKICGFWQGGYDDRLNWSFYEKPFFKFAEEEEAREPELSKTNEAALRKEHAGTIRKAQQLSKKRKVDRKIQKLAEPHIVSTPDEDRLGTDDEFEGLMDSYLCSIRSTACCGARGKLLVDDAYKELLDFVADNPVYEERMKSIPRHRVSDDGHFVCATAIAVAARGY